MVKTKTAKIQLHALMKSMNSDYINKKKKYRRSHMISKSTLFPSFLQVILTEEKDIKFYSSLLKQDNGFIELNGTHISTNKRLSLSIEFKKKTIFICSFHWHRCKLQIDIITHFKIKKWIKLFWSNKKLNIVAFNLCSNRL